MICFIVYFFADPTIKTVGFRFFACFQGICLKLLYLKIKQLAFILNYFELFLSFLLRISFFDISL
jgi:hypothetical protein